MRINFFLAGLAALAAIVHGDGGHPYRYEDTWSHNSNQNALVTSRQSPNPLRSRQALAALLTPGVAAAIASVSTLPIIGSTSIYSGVQFHPILSANHQSDF